MKANDAIVIEWVGDKVVARSKDDPSDAVTFTYPLAMFGFLRKHFVRDDMDDEWKGSALLMGGSGK
jgi:hypothetical protein